MFLLSQENSEKLLVPDQPAPTSLPGNLLQMYILHPTPHPLGQKLCGGGEERVTPQASAHTAVGEGKAGKDATRQGVTVQPLGELGFLL